MIREILKFADGNSVAVAAADQFVETVGLLLKGKHEVHINVTGGTLGILSLKKIAEHPACESLDWGSIHVWWGDDRFVPFGHADSNAQQASDALLDSLLMLDEAKVHRFPSHDPDSPVSIDEQLDAAAATFTAEVANYIPAGQTMPYFDISFVGMGPDGHVLSLFPGHDQPAAGVTVIAEHNSPKPPPHRLSFTYEAINNSGEIWFVVGGTDKAEAVSVAFSNAPSRLPVGRVHGLNKTIWFLDDAAAAGIGG
jgi:6-phosphogluconolactonase